MADAKSKFLSWLLPVLPMLVGVGFTLVTFVTGQDVNPTHVDLLNYLLVGTLGTGATGAAKSGYKSYIDYKEKHATPTTTSG